MKRNLCLFTLGIFSLLSMMSWETAYSQGREVIFYNGTSQTFSITLSDDMDGSITKMIFPGANSLGNFEGWGFTLTMPYIADVIEGNLNFYWGCEQLAGFQFSWDEDQMELWDFPLSGSCLNLISLGEGPNQVPPPVVPKELKVFNGRAEGFDITFEGGSFVNEAYQSFYIDTGMNILSVAKPGEMRVIMPKLDDVLSGSTKISWECDNVNLNDITVKDWGMWMNKYVNNSDSCSQTLSFTTDLGSPVNLIFNNNTPHSFHLKMKRRTGEITDYNITSGVNSLGSINTGEYELYLSNIPQILSGAFKLNWQGSTIGQDNWKIAPYGLKISSWKKLTDNGGAAILEMNIESVGNDFESYDYSRNFIVANLFKEPVSSIDSLTTGNVIQNISYYDGLGRLDQELNVKASPDYNDIVLKKAYDKAGRESKNYLPFVPSGISGLYREDALEELQSFYISPSHGIVQTSYPYSETVFEYSPLNRILEQGAPDSTWQPYNSSIANSGHTAKMAYESNTSSEVRLYHANIQSSATHLHTLTLLGNGYYKAGQLYKMVTKDENWITGKAGTVEEYKDKAGRVVLKRVWLDETTPLSTYYVYDNLGNLSYVLPPGANPDSGAISSAAMEGFCYQYRYDQRRRLIEKKLPGKGWEHLVYNKLDQLVGTQDSLQRAAGKWQFMKYDALGRAVMTGIFASGLERNALQTQTDTLSRLWEIRDAGNTETGYTNNVFPKSRVEQYLTINYFDDYNFPGGNPYPFAGSDMTRGLITGNRTKVLNGTLGTTDMLWNVNYYDDKGRLAKQYNQHYAGGQVHADSYDEITNSWSFTNKPEQTDRIHHRNGATSLPVSVKFSYDHRDRLVKTEHAVNGAAYTVLSENIYNGIGQLINKKWHNGLDTVTYSYNPRGWLKEQRSTAFNMELKYENGTVPQYNGNIANQTYTNGGTSKTFNYSYDKLNRLTKGEISATEMSEVLTYDVMGNIASLNRNGSGANTYTYKSSSNQLQSVANITLTDYQYDGNGNAITDGRNGMSLQYNHLNLPKSASKGDTVISYVYDALGNKLSRTRAFGSNTAIRYYAGGIEYDGTAVDIIHTGEGIARKNGNSYSYEYNVTDHLGNVRSTFYKHPTTGELDILQRDNYYAFGKRDVVSGGTNKYLYNGKEFQEELGQYDYGARFYDAEIGRWNVVDPLAEKYIPVAPYNYTINNPLKYIDPDGRDFILTITRDRQGEISHVNISATVYITGAGANKERADELNSYASGFFEKQNTKDISFNLTYKYAKGTPKLGQGENLLVFDPNIEGEKGDRSHVMGASVGNRHFTAQEGIVFSSGKSNRTVLHESLHFMGLSDRYDDKINPYNGKDVYSKSHEGFEDDIMSKGTSFNSIHKTYYKEAAREYSDKYKKDRLPLRRMIDMKGHLLRTPYEEDGYHLSSP